MKIVVDTNVLITYFWKDSALKTIISKDYFETIAPEYALEEINTHAKTIQAKASIDEQEFRTLRTELATHINFLPINHYQEQLKKAYKLCPDNNDIDFFALALKERTTIWSNDKQLKQQNKITILNTLEVIEMSKQQNH